MENIIAIQGYSSKSLRDFKFITRFNLSYYSNENAPLVVFGIYHPEDENIVRSHKDKVIVWWMGADSKRNRDINLFRQNNVINIAMMQNIVDHLRREGIPCQLCKPFMLRGDQKPVTKGNKVYIYMNWRRPEYFGKDIVDSLDIPYEILVSDYKISQDDWYAGRNDEYFSQCFVGLALSKYAGGGSSITECGLKGLKCITNLMVTPNTIGWVTKRDIEKLIISESYKIGTIDYKLADSVGSYIYTDIKNGFNLNNVLN